MKINIFLVFQILVGCIFFKNNTVYSQQYALGCEIEYLDTSMIQFKEFTATRGDDMPSSFSLKQYAPPAGNQGNIGSCTSWASAYCAFTIVKRIESNNVFNLPYSALNLHNRLKTKKDQNPCDGGNHVSEALEMLQMYGCSKESVSNCEPFVALKEYDDKLYSSSNLRVSVTDFKQALNEHSPIVICAWASTNYLIDWQNTNNIIDGVWNGATDGNRRSAHAMTIIAYDDNKAGGAFLIQNSWGPLWGENGYFWMKYTDISKVIYQANILEANPNLISLNDEDAYVEFEMLDDQVIDESVNASYFRFYNNCSLLTYISLGQYKDGQLVTEGWYPIQSGSSIDLDIAGRESNEVFWVATANNNGTYIDWADNINGRDLCFERYQAHKIYQAGIFDEDNCTTRANYYVDYPTSSEYYHVRSLSCPNATTRDGEITLNTDNEIVLVPTDLESENKNWDGIVALMDPFSGAFIQPLKNEMGKDFYAITYVKGKKIKEFNGSKEGLMKIKGLKFVNSENATNWLKASN
jgi:hypothetical protein